MLKFWAQPFQRQLFIAILFLLAPTLAAAVALGLEEFRETVEELRDQTQATALRTASAIERELTGLDRMAWGLSIIPAVRTLDAKGVEPLFGPRRSQRPSLIGLVLVDPAGRLIARDASSQDISGGWPELISPVLHQKTRVVSPLKVSPSGFAYVAVTYPVRDASGTIAAVLGCYVNPQLFQGAFAHSLLPRGSVIALADADGRILARSLEPERYVGQALDASWSTNARRPPQQYEWMDGVRRMSAEAIVAGGPWLVVVGIPMSLASDRALSLWMRTLPVLAFALGGWVLVAFAFSRRLIKSVGHLEVAAQRIASGDFKPIEPRPMPVREFAELQKAFDQMLRRFNQTRAALDEQMSEERRMLEEVQSLQRQVIRQERLAAVGQLVSGVAHEINNPLQAILGFSELLRMQANVPEAIKNDLMLIQKESARACGIIRNLALFARQQTGEAEPIRLADVIASVAELRQRRLESEGIELRVEDTSRQHVLAVLTELQQVVLNFVVNAEQAIVTSGRSPGRITIRTRDEGDRVILEVEDTGPGIPPEHEARLFQPFFTTKPVGQGTGLGLSVSYGIIDSLGGNIGYRRAPAGGAIFYFDLLAASE